MRLSIHTYGTRGDVQPYLALARRLTAAGHRVTFATAARFEQFVTASGIAFAPLPDDMLDLIDTPAARAMLSGRGSLSWIVRLVREVRPMMRRMLDAQWAAASSGADAIVYHPKASGGAHIAERLGIPAFVALPLPGLTPTRAFPSPMLPFADLGPLNAVSHRLFLGYAGAIFRGPVHRWRQDVLGLPPAGGDHSIRGVPLPRLYPYSEHVVPRPSDWDENSQVTGYWFLEEPGDWRPDPMLQAFLNRGPAPVYVGFGSIPSLDPTATTSMVVKALAMAGQRGLLAVGWGGLAPEAAIQHVHVLDAAPHDRLFPHVSAVVHHGGAGTTAAALRAGKPIVVCPSFGDQPFWGRRVAALGAGPAPLTRKSMTPSTLAEAIGIAANDPAMRDRAATLGAAIRSEDGVARAVDFIERRVSEHGRAS